MAKFIVQSGTLRTTVEAESSQKAALWAVHQAMQQVLPVDDALHTNAESKSAAVAGKGLGVLDESLTVRRHGGQDRDVQTLSTMDVVQQWNEMFATLSRLEQWLRHGSIAA